MRLLIHLLFVAIFATPLTAEDVVLINGTIIDGGLGPRTRQNLRIRNGKIADIGAFKVSPGEAVIDAKNLVIAPGFIDVYNHSAAGLEKNVAASSQVLQGITTAVLGADGRGPYLVEEFMGGFDESPPALNIMTFVGHGTVRRQIMGADYKRAATPREIQLMGELVENAMREGAIGLSAALEYDPSFYSTTEELIAIAKVVARYGGIFAIHLRNEGDGVLDAVKEAIQVGQAVKMPIQIVSLKLRTLTAAGTAPQVLAEIDKARTQGVDIAATTYPYETWSAPITALLPTRNFEDSTAISNALAAAGGSQNIRIISYPKHPEFNSRTFSEIAEQSGLTEAALFSQIVADGGAEVAASSINSKDLRTFLQHPWVMVATDGGIGIEHPRSSGTFPRVLRKYVREEKALTLERAIRKMTGLPAARIGLKERGILKKGLAADIVVFQPMEVTDEPNGPDWSVTPSPAGIKYVFVNGALVVKDGQPTDARPGLALR